MQTLAHAPKPAGKAGAQGRAAPGTWGALAKVRLTPGHVPTDSKQNAIQHYLFNQKEIRLEVNSRKIAKKTQYTSVNNRANEDHNRSGDTQNRAGKMHPKARVPVCDNP